MDCEPERDEHGFPWLMSLNTIVVRNAQNINLAQ